MGQKEGRRQSPQARHQLRETQTAFLDDRAKLIDDPDHSEEEDRFVLLGMSYALKILVVCHCYRGEGGAIRIISARKATPKEMKSYP